MTSMFCLSLLIISIPLAFCKVSPINQARYVRETNSFVVTCRLSQLTASISTRTTCDFLVDLKQVPAPKQSLFSLSSSKQWVHNPEQWVLIRANKTAMHQYKTSPSSPTNTFFAKPIMDKIMDFPLDFNNDSECFSLNWYTHYSEEPQEIQFRILIIQTKQWLSHRTCVIYPWSIIHPTFISPHSSFKQNYIEIRFCANEMSLNNVAVAQKLRRDVQWQFVSVEITHIYGHVLEKHPMYFLVTDITDGTHRWYVWKSSVTIQRFLNESLNSLTSQYDKFDRVDHFAQSMFPYLL